MSSSWVLCWLSLAFLSSLFDVVFCTLKELSTASLSDPIVLYEGVLTYDNTDRPNDRLLVFPFVDGCDEAFCEKFNAHVLTPDRRTTILYNSCVCKCKDGVLFDVQSTRCLNSISINNAISEISNISSTMDDVSLNTSAFDGNETYYDPVTESDDHGLEFHIWIICMCASFVLCILFVYSAFEKRKQKRKQGKEQHSTLQSKYYAHEVAGVRKTLMECYNMPRIKARPEDEHKCDEFPERSRLSSDEDYIDSLCGSRESFLHPKWESRAPSIKVTIAETTLERLNETDEEEISDHESFGKWTPAYTQQIQSKKKTPSSRKTSPSDTNTKTSALGKRFNNVGRRICTSSAFLNLYRQKRSGADSASSDSKITAIASSVDAPATTSTDLTSTSAQPSNAIDTVVNFNGEETGVIEQDVDISV